MTNRTPTAARPARSRSEAGFTLLELLISLTLVVVMVAMTFSVFATAMTAVPRGEEAADRSGRLRMATALLTRQVRALVDYPAETEEEIHSFFIGDEQNFSFITAAPQLGGGEGLGWVTYSTDGKQIKMAERLIFSTGAVSEKEEEEGTVQEPEQEVPAAEAVLLDNLKSARFQYLRLDGSEGEWLDGWDGLEEQGPPAAIRVVLDGVGIGDSYWVQEIPVMAVVYALGGYDSDTGLYDNDTDEVFGFEEDEGVSDFEESEEE